MTIDATAVATDLLVDESVVSTGPRPIPRSAAQRLPGNAPEEVRLLDLRRWTTVRLVTDFVIAGVASFLGLVLRFGFSTVTSSPARHVALGFAVPLVWVGILGVVGAYNRQVVSSQGDEMGKVINSVAWMTVAAGFASYVLHADFSREFVFFAIPAIGLATLAGRRTVAALMRRRIGAGEALHRALLVGHAADIDEMVQHVSRDGRAGFTLCGVLSIVRRRPADAVPSEYTDVSAEAIFDEARRTNATTIALSSSILPSREVRRLSWRLEGTGVRLFVVPSLFDLAGPRVTVSGLEGLPLLDIQEPRFSGAHRVLKETMDRVIAASALVILSPLLAAVALLIRVGDRGPAFYFQERIGLNGETFRIWKFRTMVVDADARYHDLVRQAGHTGLVFKLPDDPRMTRLGRFLRRFSLDELPQLINVAMGSMSLVGPRPQRLSEVEQYDDDARRRLLVKPGITGLWQVSGRSDLTWEQSIRLDLHYVENWSVGRDIAIMARTAKAIVSKRGAY